MKKTTQRPTRKQTPRKQIHRKKTKQSILSPKNILIGLVVLFISVVSVSVLLIDQEKHTEKPKKTEEVDDKKYNEYIEEKMTQYISDGKQKFEEHTEELQNDYVVMKEQIKKKDELLEQKIEKLKKEIMQSLANKDEQSQKLAEKLVKEIDKEIAPILEKKKEKKTISDKPRLAIIIDDVSYSHQVKSIQDIGYKVNMSFLPPTSRHENSANLAAKLSTSYMVHLPLQASSFKHEEDNTLHIGDSLEKIDQRIAQIRKLYPKAIYLNNHTGSKFTEDETSMDRLMSVLKKYDFKFIDSRTTAKTVAEKYAQKHQVEFYSRNIFLDNEQNFEYIQGQLKKAINIAHKTGLAIAIGHPHKETIKVLKNSKDLLNNLEIIYADQL